MKWYGALLFAILAAVAVLGAEQRVPNVLTASAFDATPNFAFQDVWARYRLLVLALAAMMGEILAMAALLFARNRELRAARTRAVASEERYEFAIRGSNDGLWDWGLARNETYYSPRTKAILGYQDQELSMTREAWSAMVHPDDREAVEDSVRACLAGHTGTVALEYRIRHRDGHYVPLLSRGFVVADDAGRARRMVGTYLDLTERKRYEERLIKQEHYLRDVLDGASTAIFMIDTNHRVVLWNRACETLTGVSREVMLGERAWRGCYREPRPVTADLVVSDATPIKDGEGKVLSVVQALQDVSSLKAAESLARGQAGELRRAQQLARMCSATVDLETGRVEFSDAALDLFDWDADKPLEPAEVVQRLHPDDAALVHAAHARLLRGEPVDLEFRILSADQVKWLHARAEARAGADGRPRTIAATLQDITVRKTLELRLRESESRGTPMGTSSSTACVTRTGAGYGFWARAASSHAARRRRRCASSALISIFQTSSGRRRRSSSK